jgi:hypothetical protein
MFWPELDSLTRALPRHEMTPFFGRVQVTVSVKVNTNLPVVGVVGGNTRAASWPRSGGARTAKHAQAAMTIVVKFFISVLLMGV